VIVGGLVTATLLTLLVVPSMYLLLERRFERANPKLAPDQEDV
jgi:cobalt-zinc-cadmium resistance protein CzcA